jgi:hypothetical protein
MANSLDDDLRELALALASVQAQIAACTKQEKTATDQAEKIRLLKEREDLKGRETALLREMKRLNALTR